MDLYHQAAVASIPAMGSEMRDIYIAATSKGLVLPDKRKVTIAFEQAEKEQIDIRARVRDGTELRYVQPRPGTRLTIRKSVDT